MFQKGKPLTKKEDDAMETSMNPSEMTREQGGKIGDLLVAGLMKASFQSSLVQQVIEQQGKPLVVELVAVVRKFVEAMNGLLVRIVTVNRARTPQEAIGATGRKQYVDASVVSAMPKGNGDTAEVVFFNVGRFLSDNDLESELALRNLGPVDPYSLAAVNEADPAFADEHPNATHWKDFNGKWCYAAFYRWPDGGRHVSVRRRAGGWRDGWWFAGLRK